MSAPLALQDEGGLRGATCFRRPEGDDLRASLFDALTGEPGSLTKPLAYLRERPFAGLLTKAPPQTTKGISPPAFAPCTNRRLSEKFGGYSSPCGSYTSGRDYTGAAGKAQGRMRAKMV